MPATREELVGTFKSFRYESDGFVIANLDDRTAVLGYCQPSDLVPGLTYRFHGHWQEDPKYGRQFRFDAFVQDVPHSVHGVKKYLARNCYGIGPTIAHQICDLFGADRAVATLKTNPDEVARQVSRLSVENARQAAEDLKRIQEFEQTRIDLMDLFAGRGFPNSLIEACIKRFGVLAPQRIKRDPFVLLVSGMPGCGFLRVDRLYVELGLPQERIKRQMLCAWHYMRSDMSGSTWYAVARVRQAIEERVTSNVRADRAIQLGLRAKWLSETERNGKRWLAEYQKACDEEYVATRLTPLCISE